MTNNHVRMSQIVDAIAAFKLVEALVKGSHAPRDVQIWDTCMQVRVDLEARIRMFDDVEVLPSPPTTTL